MTIVLRVRYGQVSGDIRSFGTARRAQARACLSTWARVTVVLLTFSVLVQGGGGYGVEVAGVEGRTLSAADTAVAKGIWGPTRCSRAKEVLWGLLARGFYVSPLWGVQYQHLLRLARQVCIPGTTQTLVQAVLEYRDPPPSTGPVGRALQAARQLGWQRREIWWHWDVPG